MKSPLISLTLLALFLLSALPQGQAADIEQARKEGDVVLYSTITVGAFNELNKAIKEKYPFLDVQHVRLGPAQQLARIMQEQRAGKFMADVVCIFRPKSPPVPLANRHPFRSKSTLVPTQIGTPRVS
jgi:hypothetical protein